MENPEEEKERKRLQARLRDLERKLAQREIQEVIQQSYLEIACEQAGIEDLEQFKKEFAEQARSASFGANRNSGQDPGKG